MKMEGAEHADESPSTRLDDGHWQIYSALAARRLQWDNLVWQAPALSLTAQAFLLTITLSADYQVWPRRMAAALALAICLMSLNLLARHRLSELTDAHLLAALERRHAPWLQDFQVGDDPPVSGAIHGSAFADRRETVRQSSRDGALFAFVAKWPSSRVWFWGLALFGLVALIVEVGSFLQWTAVFPPPRP